MVSVCVIGGGTAGGEAAQEAASLGAEVTVIEPSENTDPPWRSWPDLIGISEGDGTHAYSGRKKWGESVKILRCEAKTAGPGFVVTTEGFHMLLDRLVIATGSSFLSTAFRGSRKPGVVILDSPGRYATFSRDASRGETVVAGEGFRGLQVADRVGHRSRKVRLIISEWQTEGPSPAILSLILEAARERGVSVAGGPITGAAGSGALEAVVTASEVIPCAVLAIVPRRVPRVISMDARLGRLGGLSVDRCMKTSASGVFAVGGCAELDPGYVPSALLEGDASVSGRIGGANCMGEGHAISLERFNELTAFGLRWTRAGVGFGGARSSGIEVGVATGRTGGSSACQILYEKRSKRVVGVETVAPTDTISQGVVPLSTGVSLQTLAYGGLGSSDISLISDTARLGLREWQKS